MDTDTEKTIVAERPKTREEKIAEFSALYDKHMQRAGGFQKQHLELCVALKEMDEFLARRVRNVLEDNPEASTGALMDKVLQLSGEKKEQLLNNIKKTKVAVDAETRRAREYAGRRNVLQIEIHNEKIDAHARAVEAKVGEWLRLYKGTLNFFDNELCPLIQDGYSLASDYFKKIKDPTIAVSIESHFRHGERVYMSDVIEKIENLGGAYGEPLLQKSFRGTWPENPESPFYRESDLSRR